MMMFASAALAGVPGTVWGAPSAGDLFNRPRFYLALDLGYHWPRPINATSLGLAPDNRPYNWLYRINPDWAAFGRVGYRVSRHWRVEFDAGLRESNINSIHAPGPNVSGFSVGRPAQPYALCDHHVVPPPCARIAYPHTNWAYADDGMINVIYDLLPGKRLNPFVGVGGGIYHLQFDAHFYFSGVPGPISPANPATQQLQLGGSIDRLTQLAAQGIGGFSYRLQRRLALDFVYRFICAPNLRWNTLNDTPHLNQRQGLQPHDFHGSAQDETMTVGLRYSL